MLNFHLVPQVGDVPPTLGDLPHAVETAEVTVLNMNMGENNLPSVKEINWAEKLEENQMQNSEGFTPAQQSANCSINNSRRRRNILLHRCSNSCCIKNSRTPGSHGSNRGSQSTRGTGTNSAMTYTNIPFEKQDGTQTWPPRHTTTNNRTYEFYNLHHNSRNPTWCHTNNPEIRSISTSNNLRVSDATTLSNTPVLLARGIQHSNSQPQNSLQQQQMLPHSRRKAIEYMMARLQVRFSEREGAVYEAVKQRIERLENQVYNSAKTKEEYVQLVFIKLSDIMDRLYNNYTSRTTSVHPAENSSVRSSVNSPVHTSVRPQSACV